MKQYINRNKAGFSLSPAFTEKLVSSLLAGLVSGLVALISCVSFAALIFNGQLADSVFVGINASVSTAVVAGSFITMLSVCRPVLALPDDDTVPILALMVTLVVASLPADLPASDLAATALASIALVALLTGLALTAIGLLRLGGLVRYLPHSVMGGYFAGAGLLMTLGGFKVATDLSLESVVEVSLLLEYESLMRWVPACVAALVFDQALRRFSGAIVMPAIFIALCLSFFAAAYGVGYTPSMLMAEGVLLGPFPEGEAKVINPVLFTSASDIHWNALFMHPGSFLTIIMLSAVSLMLTVSGLSLLQQRGVDINRELRVSGWANTLSGLTGGLTALPSMALSKLAMDVGAPPSRWVGIVAAALCAATLYGGLDVLAWLPKPVLAGLLIYLGWTFLQQWLLESRSQMPSLEYGVIWIIVGVVVLVGFLEGVVVGLLCAVVLFVVNYSRINVVRYSLTGAQLSSNVDRNQAEAAFLGEHGEQILVAKLQGYLFFGTSADLVARLDKWRQARERKPLRFLLFDFNEVNDMDASAANSFTRIAQEAAKTGFVLVMTGLSDSMMGQLRSSGFDYESMDCVEVMQDLDRGLEWCEEQVLSGQVVEQQEASLLNQFYDALGSWENVEILLSYFEQRRAVAGDILAREGEPSDELFLLETCSASVYLGTDLETMHRIRRASSGTVFGEVGFYLGTPRTASVIVDDGGELYVFTREEGERLNRDHPHIASQFHSFMLRLVTRRLQLTTSTLRVVLA
ncbi:STAS domain-containing protein [Halioglobus maricola]|uniref:STAS domain-containing protein n=1 Tax=Halioglobus maricola TaxID=2601894 RepID=A0A5P9NQL4_9GAMM|nr:SulP family inorganic anion transporter [Halioglobus maricola]QFU77158.1 STAS domain-containing protein [Halioglobus maricola]